MLNFLSWRQYYIFLLVATLIYYSFVWIIYFKAKLPSLSQIGPWSRTHEDTGEIASYITRELKPLFTPGSSKADIILALQQKLSKYADYTEPGLRDAVNNFIMRECEEICSIHLSKFDMSAVWS